MARRGLLQELRWLLTPEASIADVTGFLRLHAKKLQCREGLELFQEQDFRQVQRRVHQALPTIDGQSMCNFLYWARSSFENAAASRLEALPNPKAAETRISELCAMGAFRTRQLTSLLRDMRTLRLNCTSLEAFLEQRLANDHEQFSPENLRQVMYILANIEMEKMNVELLERTLSRWNQTSLEVLDVGLVSGIYSDLLRLSRCYRLPVIAQTLWSATELITAKADFLSESDLRYLLPSLIIAPAVPTDLVQSLLKRACGLSLTYQSRLALIALNTKPQFRVLFSSPVLNSLFTALALDLDSLSHYSFEELLRSLLPCRPLPGYLHAKIKSKCEQSNTPSFLLQWAQFEPDFLGYVTAQKARFENIKIDVPLRDLMLFLLLVGTHTDLPGLLKSTLSRFDVVIASKVRQQTLACINSFLILESIYPVESLRFKPHYKALLEQLAVYLPDNKVTMLKFLYKRKHAFPEEVKQVVEANRDNINKEDLQGLIRNLPISERLSDICAFLSLLRPILTVNTLCQALKFEFHEIPPLYTDLILSTSGKLTTDPYFLMLSDRLFSSSQLPPPLLTRLASELEGKITASEPLLRIASFLIERNALSDQAKAKLIWLAQLSTSFPTHRILTKSTASTSAPSLSSAVDHIIIAARDPAFSQSLQFAARELMQLPLLHALSVFEQYSVSDAKDEVTHELLTALWPKVAGASVECKLRFLSAASEVQWGSSAQISTLLTDVLNDYARISQEDKRTLARILGQLAYQGAAWTQLVIDLTNTKEDKARNGPLLLHSLHQGRCLLRGLWKSVCKACLFRSLNMQERLSGKELQQLLIVALPTGLHSISLDIQLQAIERLNQHPISDFHTLLLQNYFQKHPTGVPLGNPTMQQAVAQAVFKHPLVTRTSEVPKSYYYEEGVILGGGYLVPYYNPREGKGLWVANRTISILNGALLGDFAQYAELGTPLVKLEFRSAAQVRLHR